VTDLPPAPAIEEKARKEERERLGFIGPDGKRWVEGDSAYDGEICEDCERPVARCIGSWWRAPDDLWVEVVGDKGGILCPHCFRVRCVEKGLPVHFLAALNNSDYEKLEATQKRVLGETERIADETAYTEICVREILEAAFGEGEDV
jgi:hypothetical protein